MQGVDPVIKMNHSVEMHSTGKLVGATCSNTIGDAHLGALWERTHTFTFIRMTQIKTSTAREMRASSVSQHHHADSPLLNRQHISTTLSNNPSSLFGMLLKHNRQLDGTAYPYCLIHALPLFTTRCKHSRGV